MDSKIGEEKLAAQNNDPDNLFIRADSRKRRRAELRADSCALTRRPRASGGSGGSAGGLRREVMNAAQTTEKGVPGSRRNRPSIPDRELTSRRARLKFEIELRHTLPVWISTWNEIKPGSESIACL